MPVYVRFNYTPLTPPTMFAVLCTPCAPSRLPGIFVPVPLRLGCPQAAAESKVHKREQFVLSAAYSPDGRRLAAGCMDGTVAVWDLATSKLLGKCEGHHKPVRSLTFTSGG